MGEDQPTDDNGKDQETPKPDEGVLQEDEAGALEQDDGSDDGASGSEQSASADFYSDYLKPIDYEGTTPKERENKADGFRRRSATWFVRIAVVGVIGAYVYVALALPDLPDVEKVTDLTEHAFYYLLTSVVVHGVVGGSALFAAGKLVDTAERFVVPIARAEKIPYVTGDTPNNSVNNSVDRRLAARSNTDNDRENPPPPLIPGPPSPPDNLEDEDDGE